MNAAPGGGDTRLNEFLAWINATPPADQNEAAFKVKYMTRRASGSDIHPFHPFSGRPASGV